MARGILVPRLGIEPAFPALEGGFLTTGLPGKSPAQFLDGKKLDKMETRISIRHAVCMFKGALGDF